MRCEDVQALLVAYRDGELVGRQEEHTRAHLDGCDACRSELRALERTDALLEGYVVPAGPGVDFVARLREKIRGRTAVEAEGAVVSAPRRGRIIRGPWQRGWAVAAAAVLLLAIGIGVVRQRTRNDGSEAREAVAQRTRPTPAGRSGLPSPAWQTPREWPRVARTQERPARTAQTPAAQRPPAGSGLELDAQTEAAIVRELDVLENLEVVEGMDVLEAIDLLDDPALDLVDTEAG